MAAIPFRRLRGVGVEPARAEHLDRQSRPSGRPAVAAPACDRQPADVVLPGAFSKDVIPKADPLDQFTLRVAQPRHRLRVLAHGDAVHFVQDVDDPLTRTLKDVEVVAEELDRVGTLDARQCLLHVIPD